MTVLQFFQIYWREILAVLSVIATLVIWFIKKKPSLNELDNILLKVLEVLPTFILQAESIKGAEEKKALVLESVRVFVKDQFSINLPDTVMALVGTWIENILSTPQKH